MLWVSGLLMVNDRQARALQASLLDLVDRVEMVRTEHEKLEGSNRFLQSYGCPGLAFLLVVGCAANVESRQVYRRTHADEQDHERTNQEPQEVNGRA